MNNNMLCSKCGKRPAVVFISKIQGDDSTQEGLCLKCAMDMNIGPIKQFMEKMGITEEEVEAVSEQLGDAMDAMGDVSTVTVHIQRIRDKIEKNQNGQKYIETVWGAGYRFKVK